MCAENALKSIVFLDIRHDTPREIPSPVSPIVLSLGNFDGVHKAHIALIEAAKNITSLYGEDALCGVFSFFRPSSDYKRIRTVNEQMLSHSLDLKNPDERFHLTTLKEKIRIFKSYGVDVLCLCDFSEIQSYSSEAFIRLLSEEIKATAVVCGYNYRFGKGGVGTPALLKQYFDCPERKMQCTIVDPYLEDGEPVSSTRVRNLLIMGQPDSAAKIMGRPYALISRVVKGKQLGRKLGFPTANQNFLHESLIPAHGVYVVRCHTPNGIFPGVANVGSHPTVDRDARVNCETYIIGDVDKLYGYPMRTEFLHRIRSEEHFSSVEALTDAIRRDVSTAMDYFDKNEI